MNTYRRHRFPPDTMSYAVWPHYRFNLSHRDIDGLLAERGITVSHEATRLWCIKFGAIYTRRLKRRHQGYGDTWLIDEVFVKINGKRHYLWRAVDQDGEVVDVGVAHRELIPEFIHDTERCATNRAEQSHEATRVQERGMRKFKLTRQAQRFVTAHAAVSNLFNLGSPLVRARHYRDLRISAFAEWSRTVA